MNVKGKTLPNAIVSNGTDVTCADADGNYRLPLRGTHVYCVVTPGYSPFKGAVVPLSGADRIYDFLPEPCEHPRGAFVFAQMADCHVAEPGSETISNDGVNPDLFESALRQIRREASPDFVMLTGDQVQKGTLGEISLVNDVIKSVGLPAVHVNGNHEGDVVRDDAAEVGPAGENFDTYFGPKRF
ncbi:MAG: metallophosphoesterase, partial [Phycisphaerae bacterium]|nr:metallophosphoesterase [Phycisphaerae bacterium]